MSNEMRVVIGCKGEIGRAIAKVFEATIGEDTDGITLYTNDFDNGKTDNTILHICIPYSDKFKWIIYDYAVKYKPNLIIIHSTVPVGTTTSIENFLNGAIYKEMYIAHCPVNARHPNTESDIRNYDMYVGCSYEPHGDEICDYIERFGVKTYLFESPECTEFCKLASTEYCRTMVKFFGEMKDLADKDKKLNWKEIIIFFESLMNKGDGWKRMYRRGNRIDTKISGKHCLSLNKPLMEMYKNDNKNM
jgi:hypothetical protein